MFETATFTMHGGALDAARRRFPDAPQPWLDLSTGINATPYPVATLPATAWTRLPDAADLQRLEAIAARRYRTSVSAEVVAAPGTQALIQLLPMLCGGDDVRVLGPTYGEFARVFRHAGRRVHIVPALDAVAGADVGVVVNPNNPDGRLVPARDLLAVVERVGMLVVDEAFADLLPDAASVASRASGRTIVLRSFGKTFGLAGLRLGFALASNTIAARLRALLGPWPVSGPALAVGAAALADDAWLEATRGRLPQEVARLNQLLRQAGGTCIGGTPLFTLIDHPAAPALFMHLARAGILTRPFADAPGHLRFGVPGAEADWARLHAALASFR